MDKLTKNFYYFGHITNTKAYNLYSSRIRKHDFNYHQLLFFLNYNYSCNSNNLNLIQNKNFPLEKIKEELKLNKFYLENNVGLFVYPNLCIKHIHTINNSSVLKSKEKKILQNVMNDELDKLKNLFDEDYSKYIYLIK